MSKVTKRKFVFLSNWDRQDLKCACLQMNPCCENPPHQCEELELELSPYEDVEECMKARRYERRKGAYRQVNN